MFSFFSQFFQPAGHRNLTKSSFAPRPFLLGRKIVPFSIHVPVARSIPRYFSPPPLPNGPSPRFPSCRPDCGSLPRRQSPSPLFFSSPPCVRRTGLMSGYSFPPLLEGTPCGLLYRIPTIDTSWQRLHRNFFSHLVARLLTPRSFAVATKRSDFIFSSLVPLKSTQSEGCGFGNLVICWRLPCCFIRVTAHPVPLSVVCLEVCLIGLSCSDQAFCPLSLTPSPAMHYYLRLRSVSWLLIFANALYASPPLFGFIPLSQVGCLTPSRGVLHRASLLAVPCSGAGRGRVVLAPLLAALR